MTSSVQHIKKTNSSATLSLNKRVLFLVLVCSIQIIYVPTSFRTTGGIEPKLPIDIFPVWPVWVIPYMLCYPLWLFSVAWAVAKMEDRLFRAQVAACLLMFAVANATFIFFPTYVRQMTFQGDDIFTLLLRMVHEEWGRYSAFPSGHIYITTILVLFFGRWYPRRRLLWILILTVISLSTLFTGQHYILDVLGGYGIAFAGYYFGLWWVGLLAIQHRPANRQLLFPPP